MVSRIHKVLAEKDQRDKGFTLIELLVVVIIIGILAAIAIPLYLNQQNQARDAQAKADLGNAKVAVASALVDNPSAGTVTLASTGFTWTPNVSGPADVEINNGAFCIEATSASGKIFHTTSTGGVVDGACP